MNLNKKLVALIAPALVCSGLQAGEVVSSKEPVVEEAPGSAVSGTFALTANTHFISYGADVWGSGSNWDDVLFNPSLTLSWALPYDTTFTIGTWWDVNDNAYSSIGRNIQEVDVWVGLTKSFGIVETSLLYQQWYYGGDTEQIIDLIFAFDLPFKPSVTIHGRPDEGASGGKEGVVALLGAKHEFDLGPLSMAIPFGVAFATDGYHGGDAGFAYTSVGLTASYPLPIDKKYGAWSLDGGLTFYYTDDSVIPNNPDEAFLTGSLGVSCAF